MESYTRPLRKDYEKAIIFYRKVIEINPKNYIVYEKIATIYYIGHQLQYRDFEKWYPIGDAIRGLNHEFALSRHTFSSKIYAETDIRTIVPLIYVKGSHGVTKDIQKAIEWCTKYKEGTALVHGRICQFSIYPPDYKNALQYYKNALDDPYKNYEAKKRIGMLYIKGLGVKKNPEKALDLEVSPRWDYWSGYLLSNYNHKYHEAREKFEKVEPSEDDYGDALNQLGKLYQEGLGVPRNYEKATEYFREAIKEDCNEAYDSMRDVYRYGYGVDDDYNKAFEFYTKAAESSFDTNGQFNLGMMYFEGKGTDIDYGKALYWFERASVFGNEQAHPSFMVLARTLMNPVKGKITIGSIETLNKNCDNVQVPNKTEPRQSFQL